MFERFYAESHIFRDNITLFRRFHLKAFIQHIVDEYLAGTTAKETVRIMAVNQATDDQVFTQIFSLADADAVPVDGTASPVTVAVVDSTGADVSKWIDVQQDSANPLKFVYSRKTDDGTQPQDLAFTSVGTATVNGAPSELKTDYEFTPGAAKSLTSTVTVGAAAPASTDGAATGAASADGTGTGGTVPVEQQQGGQQAP